MAFGLLARTSINLTTIITSPYCDKIASSYDIRRSSSSAHPHPYPHQGLGLVAAQRTLVHARESCVRQREDLELKHVRWEDAARRWQEKAQAEAKWTRELLADLEEKGMSMSIRG